MAAQDPVQQKALNALEPFILLSKSANSPRAAADLVNQATSAPNTFLFIELLETPNIQALQSAPPEHASSYKLLQIFAWGTWEEYSSQKESLPALSAAQSTKLRQLTLLTLCQHPDRLTYKYLLPALSLPDTRALEDLVISAIYAGLLTAQLNPLAQRIDVSSVASVRDLKPGSVPQMISILEDWDKRCLNVLDEIEGKIKEKRRQATERKRREDALEKHFNKLVGDDLKVKAPASKRAVGDGEEMEVDDGLGNTGGRTRSAKRGGGKLMGGVGRRLGGD